MNNSNNPIMYLKSHVKTPVRRAEANNRTLTAQTIHETHFWSVFHKNVNPDNFIKRQPTNKYTVGKPLEENKKT